MATGDIPAFDDLPSFDDMQDETPQPAQAQASRPLMFDDLPSFDDMQDEQLRPQAEGALKTFGREATHSVLPAAGGMATAGGGAAIGAEIGSAVGPLGTLAGGIIGGLGGMIAGSMLTEKVQDTALDALGIDDSTQRAANIAANPKSAFAGSVAPMVATMSPAGGARAIERVAGGALMGGFEVGQEAYENGNIDPTKVAAMTALGAAMPRPNRIGAGLARAGESAVGAAGQAVRKLGGVAGRPGVDANPEAAPTMEEATSSQQATVTGESSLQQPAPSADGSTTGNPQSAPERSERLYPKGKKRSPQNGTDPLTSGTFTPDVAEALQASQDANAVQDLSPLPEVPRPDVDAQNMTNPGERIPIQTGIVEAAQAMQKEAPPAVHEAAPGVAPTVANQPPAAQAAIAKSKRRRQPAPEPLAAAPEAPIKTGIEEAAATPEGTPEAHPPVATSEAPAAPRAAEPVPAFDDIPNHPHAMIDREKVNVNPSDAQKEAGNYEKAPVRVMNREAKVETPEGAVRRSKSTDKVQWENTSPYDYGHFLRTVGADGDPIDVAIGKGDKHFIVDQRDADTGKFDEHKVFAHFEDARDAMAKYENGFSDDRGQDRLQAITEVTPEAARAWMDDLKKNPDKRKLPYAEYAGKEATGPTEGVKPEPKVVTAAVNKMRETGISETDIAKFQALPIGEQLKAANRALRGKTTDVARPDRMPTKRLTVDGLVGDDGKPIQARDANDKARKDADVKTMNDAYAKVGDVKVPSTPEEKAALREKLQSFLDETKDVKYRPTVKHEPYLLARAAKKLLLAKNPTDKSWTEFASTAKQLAEGGVKDVRQTARIEADIDRSRRAGDEAVANAEAARADPFAEEDRVLDAIDRKRALEEKGEFDIAPAEEGPETAEPVTTAKDVARVEKVQQKLDLTKEADRTKLQTETAKLADNLVKTAERQAPVGESEGAASKVRKVDPAKVNMDEIMARLNKAQAKGKESPGAIREEELGKFSDKPPERDALSAFWNNESGALDFNKITRDFRTTMRAPLRFYTKMLGGMTNDVQRRADAILAHALSTEDSRLAEKAHALMDARYYQWIDKTTKAEQATYLKVIEKPENDTVAKLRQALTDAGIAIKKIAWMIDEALFHRGLMNRIWQEDAKYGSLAGYVKNYVSHIFEDDAGAEKFINDRIHALGPTWYQKERMFDLMEQAIKAGFKPKFSNPIDLINARWAASIRANGIVAAARSLEKAGLAFPVKDAPDHAGTWAYKRQLPDRQQWVFAPDAAMLWENSIEPAGLNENKGTMGSIWRTWMGIKNVITPIQLILSAFHELHIVGNIMPAQALHQAFTDYKGGKSFVSAYGGALKNIGNDALFALPLDKIPYVGQWLDHNDRFSNYVGRRVQDIWRMDDSQLTQGELMTKRMFQEAGVSPYQSREDIIGAKRKFAQALANMRNEPGIKNIPAVAWAGISRGIEKLQEPMFKYQIPSLKNAALLRAMTSAIQQRPELASNHALRGQVFRELGKDIDDRFGEMFYKGLFWNKALKDAGVGSFLSLSWNLGQLRQAGGAAREVTRMLEDALGAQRSPLEQARNRASNKMSFVSHYVGLSMLTAGALSWALSGEMPTGLDYIFPRSGQLDPETGHPQRLTSPFNTREAVMLKAHADEHNSWLGGALQLIWNKMVLQPVAELATNKDFFGRQLYDTNAPAWKEALQATDSTLGRVFSPIAISGADRAKQQGTGLKGQLLSYAGFGPGPKYVNETPLERRINHLSHQYQPAQRPYEYGEKTGLGRGLVQGTIRAAAGDELQSEARTNARNQMFQARAAGDNPRELAAREKMVKEGGLSPRIVNKIVPGRQAEGEYARLPLPEQLALAKTMNKQEFTRFVLTNKLPKASRDALVIQQRSLNP